MTIKSLFYAKMNVRLLKHRTYMIILFIICTGLYQCQTGNEETKTAKKMMKDISIEAPKAAKHVVELEKHGDVRIDPYYWMNDREDPEVIAYLNAENAYREAVMEHTTDMQDTLYKEIIGRIKQDDSSVPYMDNGYYYYTRYEEGKEYPIYCRKEGALEAEESILLNANDEAKKYAYYNASGLRVSPDNKVLVYGEDTLSRRIYTLKFKDLESGKMLKDRIPNTTGYAYWGNDNKTVFYVTKDETLRPNKVWRHVLGSDVSEDEVVWTETDSTFVTYVYKSKSGKYMIIGSYSTLTTEFQILRADNPGGTFRIFQPRERKLEYDIAHRGNKFYVRTNLNAQNFRLMECSEDATTKENWSVVIPHREDVLLEGVDVFDEYLAIIERIKGIRNIRIMPDKGEDHYIDFGEDAYVASFGVNRVMATNMLRLGYSSLTTPYSTFDYNMRDRQLTLKKEQEVLGGFDKSNYESERIYAPGRDGTRIPISLVYRKGTKLDGSAPLLLYGYGSYGYSMDPYFSSPRLSLLDRGFIFAMAHIRGGEELGRKWYEEGKLLNKKNTFTDFIDCAQFLLDERYTSTEKLFAMGGSAGGLLMGAVVNMKPGIWKGIVAAVPFVDVVTTMLDESIPLTTGEYDEWGNPNDPVFYEYIKSYSPYDNVMEQDYPAMLITTGLHDSQVQYWEPAKWVAKLREMKTDNNPLLLYTNMDTGHGGASGRFARHRETAMEYAFLLDLSGYQMK